MFDKVLIDLFLSEFAKAGMGIQSFLDAGRFGVIETTRMRRRRSKGSSLLRRRRRRLFCDLG
jgi:hypothetical protein